MPFKSKSQMGKMAVLEKQGKVKKGTVKEWAAETPDLKKLPMKKSSSQKGKVKNKI